MPPVSVRYIVDDVDTAVAFYEGRLGFDVEARPGPGFAIVSRGPLRLLLSTPDLDPAVRRRPCPTGGCLSRAAGTASSSRSTTWSPWSRSCARPEPAFRNDIVTGRGGKQILLDDPSGNPIELFEPARD